jgi:hypothetical protein
LRSTCTSTPAGGEPDRDARDRAHDEVQRRVGDAEGADGAEHERGRPGQAPDQLVRGDRHRAHRREHGAERQHAQRAQLGAQLARRGVEAGRGQQRRQEDEEDDVGVDDHLGQARHRARRQPDQHERDRIRDAQPRGGPHERGGPEQQQEQELEVGHG